MRIVGIGFAGHYRHKACSSDVGSPRVPWLWRDAPHWHQKGRACLLTSMLEQPCRRTPACADRNAGTGRLPASLHLYATASIPPLLSCCRNLAAFLPDALACPWPVFHRQRSTPHGCPTLINTHRYPVKGTDSLALHSSKAPVRTQGGIGPFCDTGRSSLSITRSPAFFRSVVRRYGDTRGTCCVLEMLMMVVETRNALK